MFLRSVAAFVLIGALGAVAFGQGATGVNIDNDLRVFTTVAALNAAGFDVELGAQYHPVRVAVRKFTENVDPDLLRRMKQSYTLHKGQQTDESQLARYISLALTLTDPPELKPAYKEEVLPQDAREIVDFAPLLSEFYQKAHISQLWSELRPEYERKMDQLGPPLREAFLKTDAYLRESTRSSNPRSLFIYVELAAPTNSVNVRSNQDDYYVVLGDSTTPKIDDVRHAYLHFQLDNFLAASLSSVANGNALLALVSGEDGVQREYTRDFRTMLTESLIRAIELRLDRAARADEAVKNYYRTGLLLVPYFYTALQKYERAETGVRDNFAEMAKGIDLKTERERFQLTFEAIPVPARQIVHAEVPVPPPADPLRDLLREAQQAFNGGDDAKAQTAFETVLTKLDANNGSAFYGLGLVASRLGNSDAAAQYFERTVKSSSAEPGMKVWAYIYMGRISDLACERPKAVEYYRQAIQVGDDTRNAQSVAKAGVSKAYGNVCQ